MDPNLSQYEDNSSNIRITRSSKMITETQQTDQSSAATSSSSATTADSSVKIRAWIKLAETCRKTSCPPISLKTFANSNLTNNLHNGASTINPSIQQNENSLSPPSTTTNGHQITAAILELPNSSAGSPHLTANAASPCVISLASTPARASDEVQLIESTPPTAASSPTSTDTFSETQQSPTRQRKITIRKSNKSKITLSKQPSTDETTDDDILLLSSHRKPTPRNGSIAPLSQQESAVPLATELQSLPGNSLDEPRDNRFLDYTDVNTLCMHASACLQIDKMTSSPKLPVSRQRIFKTRGTLTNNILSKIYRIHYLKKLKKQQNQFKINIRWNNKKENSLPTVITSKSPFVTDWLINRRSAAGRMTPRNLFHSLQTNPTKKFSQLFPQSSSITSDVTSTSIEIKQRTDFERIKDVLARTYYPHLYNALECGYHFGVKSKLPNTSELVATHQEPLFVVPIKEMPSSPMISDELTINLQSPLNLIEQTEIGEKAPLPLPPPPTPTPPPLLPTLPPNQPKKRGRKPKNAKLNSAPPPPPDLPAPSAITRRISVEIDEISPPLVMRESIVVLTPTPLSMLPSQKVKETSNVLNRKRKASTSKEKPKKRILSSPVPETPSDNPDTAAETDSDDNDDTMPVELPKQSFIKNGLRSNYYKITTPTDTAGRSPSNKSRLIRKRRPAPASLPTFYTGLFESDDGPAYIDYRLPFDIYWFGQKQVQQTAPALPTVSQPQEQHQQQQHKKKKSSQPKQKQPLPYKKILRNVYADPAIRQNLLASHSSETIPMCECELPGTCEDGICLNRMIYTECVSSCACGMKCSNQKIRKNQWSKHVEVFDTGKYGQGLRANAPILKGTFVCEYVGEIITEEIFLDRMTNMYSKDDHHYTMKLTQNLVIDAYRMGNIARFANHSCSPNCEFQKWTVDGLQRMCMFTLRPIRAREELTYDYNFQCFNLQAQQPCYCESLKCRRTIGTKQQSNTNTSTTNNNNWINPTGTMQKLTLREKRSVWQHSIFLVRNLRRIKAGKEHDKKDNEQRRSRSEKQLSTSLSLFFAQNYYHTNKALVANLRKNPKLLHKDIFHLFYNYIRHTHFAKTHRWRRELIDRSCHYARQAQLALVLNELFEILIGYKCPKDDTCPAIALKKCPSKRLYPAYYEIITKPIDLTRIGNKLDNGEYVTYDQFEEDLLLLFSNAITYCGEDSAVTGAVIDLQKHFIQTLKPEYKSTLDLFNTDNQRVRHPSATASINPLEEFIARSHHQEVVDGIIRHVLYEIIFDIEQNDESEDSDSESSSPIVYKIVVINANNTHRASKSVTSADCIVHCRCGSVYEEISLVQCYACQLWQHLGCVTITDPNRPYFCFECNPACEYNSSSCLKTNVIIAATSSSPTLLEEDNFNSYSTLTRADGFIVRTNECYFITKQPKNDDEPVPPHYDILFVERLWIDDQGTGQASGFYYIRPDETFHEPNRRFFTNELLRFPSSSDAFPINIIVRPCYVLDCSTYCKGKPVSDNSSRVLVSDLFICEYRVDKTARTFTRIPKSRQIAVNTKSYCFDNYVEKLITKRDYQPHKEEVQQQENRRKICANPYSHKKAAKRLEEKRTRMDGILEKLYCRFHDSNQMPNESKSTLDQILQQDHSIRPHLPSRLPTVAIVDSNNNRGSQRLKAKKSSTPALIEKKRRTISLSSDDDIVELVAETHCQKVPKSKKNAILPTNNRKRPMKINDEHGIVSTLLDEITDHIQ